MDLGLSILLGLTFLGIFIAAGLVVSAILGQRED
jgi:hypothetical protein